jgi:hypothetical protein
VNLHENFGLVDELIDALHEHVVGITAETAAVDLLANHRVWLTRPDFVRFIQHGRRHCTGQPTAMIRWRAAHLALAHGQLPGSNSKTHILRIATSLAIGVPISLKQVLGCLDHRNIAHVIRAIGIANDTWPIDLQGNQP